MSGYIAMAIEASQQHPYSSRVIQQVLFDLYKADIELFETCRRPDPDVPDDMDKRNAAGFLGTLIQPQITSTPAIASAFRSVSCASLEAASPRGFAASQLEVPSTIGGQSVRLFVAKKAGIKTVKLVDGSSLQ